jgi:hypothetical protein
MTIIGRNLKKCIQFLYSTLDLMKGLSIKVIDDLNNVAFPYLN